MIKVTFIPPIYKGANASASVKYVGGEHGIKFFGAMKAEIVPADADRARLENLAATVENISDRGSDEYYNAFEALSIEAHRASNRFYGAQNR